MARRRKNSLNVPPSALSSIRPPVLPTVKSLDPNHIRLHNQLPRITPTLNERDLAEHFPATTLEFVGNSTYKIPQPTPTSPDSFNTSIDACPALPDTSPTAPTHPLPKLPQSIKLPESYEQEQLMLKAYITECGQHREALQAQLDARLTMLEDERQYIVYKRRVELVSLQSRIDKLRSDQALELSEVMTRMVDTRSEFEYQIHNMELSITQAHLRNCTITKILEGTQQTTPLTDTPTDVPTDPTDITLV